MPYFFTPSIQNWYHKRSYLQIISWTVQWYKIQFILGGTLRMKKGLAKRISICLMSSMLVFSSVPGTAQAHSGRTDSSGGHHDNKNKSGLGSYHYHCGGNPAHLHDGGVCPYSSNATTTVATSVSGGGVIGGNSSTSASTTATATNAIKLSSGVSITISKDIIKIVQDVLNQKGYDCGTVDGSAGNKTKTALKKYLDDNSDSDDTDYLILKMVAEGLGVE